MSRRKCNAPTARGTLCQNYWDTCPHQSHKHRGTRQVAGASAAMPAPPRPSPTAKLAAGTRPEARLSDSREAFNGLVSDTSDAYGLPPAMIARDYWLVRTLHAWASHVGFHRVARPYPASGQTAGGHAGRVVFGGGTSLSAAWGITERWSEDIDLIFDPAEGTKPRHFKQACKAAAITVSKSLGGGYNSGGKSGDQFFFEITSKDGLLSNVDLTRQDMSTPPLLVQEVPVSSMIGRIADEETLLAYPELGGFGVPSLGPGSTAMNKLLAQTQMSESGDLGMVRYRARDVYDLACIAARSADLEGHIGRDSRALLHISEGWLRDGAPVRPPDGFASLRSFDASTPEHEALAEGYEDVVDRMVWGEKIPLGEAIKLALTLDPGPFEPHRPPDQGDHHWVCHPR